MNRQEITFIREIDEIIYDYAKCPIATLINKALAIWYKKPRKTPVFRYLLNWDTRKKKRTVCWIINGKKKRERYKNKLCFSYCILRYKFTYSCMVELQRKNDYWPLRKPTKYIELIDKHFNTYRFTDEYFKRNFHAYLHEGEIWHQRANNNVLPEMGFISLSYYI